ncbi:DUF1491 family protein [Sphingomonas solaris]|uniref:DUF1491 family protein n=1 Tax=Alterirhizorhabdus solaris TaxID=2529389 RepID=A0A558R3H9_9SPHN|nr:DUF1491 family protein [Sphingomonas solaris]TVV73888.1 DUF1491 family protein [Sphingomonas solaris]
MTPRLAAGLLVSALVRAVEAAGGGAMVLAKGDATAGAILLVTATRGRTTGLYERTLGPDDAYGWTRAGPALPDDDPAVLADYLARRRRADPDQWIVELDHADPLAIAQGMIAGR